MAMDYSTTWQYRMRKEYNELVERITKLHIMIGKYNRGELEFNPNCDITVLQAQECAMDVYARILEYRFKLEGIDKNG